MSGKYVPGNPGPWNSRASILHFAHRYFKPPTICYPALDVWGYGHSWPFGGLLRKSERAYIYCCISPSVGTFLRILPVENLVGDFRLLVIQNSRLFTFPQTHGLRNNIRKGHRCHFCIHESWRAVAETFYRLDVWQCRFLFAGGSAVPCLHRFSLPRHIVAHPSGR